MRSRTVQPIQRRANKRDDREEKKRRKKRLGLDKIFIRGNTQYFDFDLLLVIIFLMCFGLVMLYSTSAYSAQADFNNDMFYFSKQAFVGVVSFGVMLLVSRIDYHFYGAFSFEIFVFAMIMMGLVQTPLGVTIYGARRWIQLPFNMTLQPSEDHKDRGDPVYLL